MKLPLVETVTDYYQGPYLDNVLVIGVQHILETTHAMFRSLYKLGLKPQNISIMGKCYSTCKEVYEEMLADGIDVDPGSFSYSSHESFDQHFENLVEEFVNKRISKLENPHLEKIIVLDDGGKFIEAIQKILKHFSPLVAVEQTSSGYETVRAMTLSFPVINVARSDVKLKLESPMIAEAAIKRLLKNLKEAKHKTEKALIIGGGPIGLAVQQKLNDLKIETEIYDIKNPDHQKKSLPELLSRYNLVLGCTGKVSVPQKYHSHFAPHTALASISSSDREFDAIHLRKKIPVVTNCQMNLVIGDLLLICNGFPVNFDGERENIDPELIQLTIALMTAGILQGVEQDFLTSRGIISLNRAVIDLIEDSFLRLRKI